MRWLITQHTIARYMLGLMTFSISRLFFKGTCWAVYFIVNLYFIPVQNLN